MGASNAAIIRKAYEDFGRGDIGAVLASFDANIAWHVPGHSLLAGDYRGHEQIGGFFQKVMELCGGTLRVELQRLLAEDDDVVALVTIKAERNGVSAAFPEVHVWRMRNGKAVTFREFQGDERKEDAFWS